MTAESASHVVRATENESARFQVVNMDSVVSRKKNISQINNS